MKGPREGFRNLRKLKDFYYFGVSHDRSASAFHKDSGTRIVLLSTKTNPSVIPPRPDPHHKIKNRLAPWGTPKGLLFLYNLTQTHYNLFQSHYFRGAG